MKHRSPNRQPLARTLGLSAASLLIAATTTQAQNVYAFDDLNNFYSFNATTPGSVNSIGTLSFQPEGMDFNPFTGQLFAIDIGATTTQLFTIDLGSGVSTAVGVGFASMVSGSYDLTTGVNFGFDFNPKTVQADLSIRIRLVSDAGANLRLHSATGLVAAVDLSGNLADAGVDAAGAAYINNVSAFPNAGTTVLKIIDTLGARVFDQNPPNNGVLANPLPLGITPTGDVGFDIFTALDSSNTAYLAAEANGTISGAEFYTVDLATGSAGLVGQIGSGLNIQDIAVQPIPEPGVCAALLAGLATLGLRRRRQA